MKNHILVILAALVGGILGHFACAWIWRQGFYGMVLPGGLAGLSAGIFRSRSLAVQIGCGLWALAIGLFTEWSLFPFNADPSLSYFLRHIGSLQSVTLLMIAAGTVIGFWIPFRRGREK